MQLMLLKCNHGGLAREGESRGAPRSVRSNKRLKSMVSFSGYSWFIGCGVRRRRSWT
jgi:hypothetical protein